MHGSALLACVRFAGILVPGLGLEICGGAQCSYAAVAQYIYRSMTTSYVSTCLGNFLLVFRISR